MTIARILFGFVVLGALLLVACGGEGEDVVRPSPAASATSTVSPLPSPLASPTVVAGIELYPADAWFAQGRSRCASTSLEAPYFGPIVFSIHEEELTELTVPAGYELLDVRVCKHGITAVGYIYDHAFVVLSDGPHEWPVSAPAELISEGTVAGRPAVFVAPTQPGEYGGAMVIVAEDFGLTVVTRTASLEEAEEIAAGINREDVRIPQGKDSFTDSLNGIRFFNELQGENRKEGCLWGNYGLEDPDVDGVEIPADTDLDVSASYLPEGYSLYGKSGFTCGGTIDLVEAEFSRKPGVIDLVVRRLSGEPAWYSVYSEDWLAPGTIAGQPAVFISPPSWAAQETDVGVQVVVKEDFGLTVVSGQVPLEEAKRIAEGLNR
jgi:hypothetical protein